MDVYVAKMSQVILKGKTMSRCGNCPSWVREKCEQDKYYEECIGTLQDALWDIDTSIIEPKQGEWKVVYDSKDSDLPKRMCSECGQKIPITARLNYCFECGVKMHHNDEATEMVNVCPTCGRSDYIRSFKDDFHIKNSEYRFKCINCNTYIK